MRILIIKPSSLGDIVHSLPFLKSLRDTFPEISIEWVISKSLSEILEGNPLVDRLIMFDKDSWKQPRRLTKTVREMKNFIKEIRSERYDMIVDLQGLLRSGLMTFLAQSPLKLGFKDAREGSRLFYHRAVSTNGVLHAVDRYLEMGKSIGVKTDDIKFPIHIDTAEEERINGLIGDLSEYIVIVPSARWDTKKWPAKNFGMLISKLSTPCVITGSKSEQKTIEQVMHFSTGKGINLCGKTSLKQLISLIAGAKMVISNDSGPMHIGAALGVPVLALFGPTDPLKTGPYGWTENKSEQKQKKLKVLRASVPCAPCFRKKCKDLICMEEIGVEHVLNAVKEYR
jgi:heptosyltransferase-1